MTARNHVIDLARVASILVVVAFHCLLYRVVVVDGSPSVVPWAPLPHWSWWTASWFIMIVPMFFIAGGFAHALVVDRLAERGQSYRHYLLARGRRLVGPMLLFVSFATVVSTAGAWLGPTGTSIGLSVQFAQLLWFIAVYLVIVAAAPAMVRAHDRWGVLPMLLLAVAAVPVDAWSFAAGRPELRNLNMFLIWPLCHQLGIAFHRGWFRRGPRWVPWLAVLGAAGTIVLLVFVLGYPGSSVGLGDIPVANVQPPTLAMAALGVAQAAVLGLLDRSGLASALPPALDRAVTLGNVLAVTIYLWHIPCIVLAGAALFGLSALLPGSAELLLSQPLMLIVTFALVALFTPLIGRVEAALIPPLTGGGGSGAVPAFGLLTAGTVLVWLNGTVLHPAQPWSAAGLLVLGAGMAWLSRAAAGPAKATG